MEKHNKGLATEHKKLWLRVANNELKRYLGKGGADEACAPKAIRIANNVVSGVKEKEWNSEKYQRKLGEKVLKEINEKEENVPYPNEHAARLTAPGKYIRFRRENDKFGAGIDAIWGVAKDGTAELQAIRFDVEKFTVAEAKKWLSDHDHKPISFEPATEEEAENISDTPDYIKETGKEEPLESDIDGDIIPIDEADFKQPLIPVKIIQPGWGTSGYYSRQLLESSAGKYKAGTLMFWDHPTESEETERPERSLRDLAGVLISDGTFKEGKAGPGVYASCKPFPEFRKSIEAMGPHIGISHRASGVKKEGEAEGKKGLIIEAISKVWSVDFVTTAGAGGQVVQLFEAAKNGGAVETLNNEEVRKMELEKKLQEAEDSLAKEKKTRETAENKLKEKEQKETVDRVSVILKETLEAVKDLPEIAKTRIKAEPILKEDGTLDEEKVKEAINKQIVEERNYLAEIGKKGEITNMGEVNDDERKEKKENLKQAYVDKYLREGKSKEQAEKMAEVAIR